MESTIIKKKYDVVVVGGGISGICAALASARQGVKTAIVQNRPVFGGNASSEVRMHICGACVGGKYEEARETGIVEEILLDNRLINPQDSFSVFDVVLWEKITFQENLDSYLNTHMYEVITKNQTIKEIICTQLGSETSIHLQGEYYIDATGDGTLGAYAGAEFMLGREDNKTYNESHAPKKRDLTTMGNTIMFLTKDLGKSVSFTKPFWAYELSESDLTSRNHDMIKGGYWWIEYGGEKLSTITDNEKIRDELLKWAYGVWDHIKNKGDHGAENFALDWVCVVPGKRESRRLLGDYVLNENDVYGLKVFDDAIAYGGWPMDMHIPGGISRGKLEPSEFIHLDGQFSIPYSTIYSKNIKNLFLGGRASSNSRMAFGATRVMATCGVIGQATGTAAALAIKHKCSPRDLSSSIDILQQQLAKDDCYIMGYRYHDKLDLSRNALITCSSNEEMISQLINGLTRNVGNEKSYWQSEKNKNEWLSFSFDEPKKIEEIILRFDSNLSNEVRITMSYNCTLHQLPGIPREITSDYELLFKLNNKVVHNITIKNNHLRFIKHQINGILADKVELLFNKTNGAKCFTIYDINIIEGE